VNATATRPCNKALDTLAQTVIQGASSDDSRGLRIAEEQFDAAMRSFGEDLQAAATEIAKAYKKRVKTSPHILAAMLPMSLKSLVKLLLMRLVECTA
jgi:hypothetical protein